MSPFDLDGDRRWGGSIGFIFVGVVDDHLPQALLLGLLLNRSLLAFLLDKGRKRGWIGGSWSWGDPLALRSEEEVGESGLVALDLLLGRS